jgi:hypothetical protein
MAKKYYCLVAGLPDILLGDKKVLFNSINLRNYLGEEVSEQDFRMIQALYLPFDHYNLISLLFQLKKEIDPRGVYTPMQLGVLEDKKQLDFLEDSDFPPYFIETAKAVLTSEEPISQIEAEKLLYTRYIQYVNGFSNAFLSEYLSFDINQKNVFAALNSRKYDLNIESELMGEGDVVEALQKSRSRDFGLSHELEYMEKLIQIFEEESLLDRELKIDRFKWEFIDEAAFFNYFTIEKVMSFVIKFLMVERWVALDEKEGRKMFQELLSELENRYEFPEEYKLRHGKKK